MDERSEGNSNDVNLLASLLTFAVSCKPISSASASRALLNGNWNNTFVKYPESQWAITAAASGKTAHIKARGTSTRRSMRCKLLNCSACKRTTNLISRNTVEPQESYLPVIQAELQYQCNLIILLPCSKMNFSAT